MKNNWGLLFVLLVLIAVCGNRFCLSFDEMEQKSIDQLHAFAGHNDDNIEQNWHSINELRKRIDALEEKVKVITEVCPDCKRRK